jgi:hypothetical protein
LDGYEYSTFVTDSLLGKSSSTPSGLDYAYGTCQGVRNEMARNNITAQQAIKNNPTQNLSGELRMHFVQLLCPYLLNR